MKKFIFITLTLCLLFSSVALAQEMSKENILQKLEEISTIENDIARLEAYDEFVSGLNIDSADNSSPSSTGGVIAEYSGNGLKNTRPFNTNSAWEIQWNAAGDIFQIYLYDSNGNLVDIAANQMQPGEGSYYSPKTGTFYLEINAMGDWKVEIVNVD
ncbi:hypothetical protein SAMN04515654_12167 [Halanaerobium congolense]|uniref:Secreted protein (Por secretion system target) n=1 Tax=Halanaerobium congolense TaxID=54121 RepID=A0A1G8PYF3_9FIRM|nr:hypothetical protein [Halanaerobium congolense]SDI97286.1 hypothetical protein SAMN04515654_12167 [Halanaerobium congolense]SES92202.1 hypothetical protein SAMN04515653_10467 [Halanaerobium congolense]